jgi:hypothetical protein
MTIIKDSLRTLLGSHDISAGIYNTSTARSNKKDRYLHLMRGINIVSYSTFGNLHTCERKFALKKLQQASTSEDGSFIPFTNIDFAFGKAIETGVQSTLLGKGIQETFFDMFQAWDMPLDAAHPRGIPKSFTDAVIAIDKFRIIKEALFPGWEIAYFNGKPAIELAMLIDLETGHYYVGHADIILYHPKEKRYRVLEIKTTGFKNLHEAMYKNSDQGTGYSIMLDSIASDRETTATFEVFYLVFATGLDSWKPFEFTKSRSMRAGWINTILLDIQRVNIYKEAGYWPKRGGSCFDYFRPCEFYDICDLGFEHFNKKGDFDIVSKEDLDKHKFDFQFKISEIIAIQKELI